MNQFLHSRLHQERRQCVLKTRRTPLAGAAVFRELYLSRASWRRCAKGQTALAAGTRVARQQPFTVDADGVGPAMVCLAQKAVGWAEPLQKFRGAADQPACNVARACLDQGAQDGSWQSQKFLINDFLEANPASSSLHGSRERRGRVKYDQERAEHSIRWRTAWPVRR